jgi:hypothetical protein
MAVYNYRQHKVTTLSAVDRGFDPRSDQIKDYKIGI